MKPGAGSKKQTNWKHTMCSLLMVASFTCHYAFEIHAFCVYQFVYLFTRWKTFGFLVRGIYK